MDHAMSGGVTWGTFVEEGPEALEQLSGVQRGEVAVRHHLVDVVEHAQLQTARTDVDYEDVHGPTCPRSDGPTLARVAAVPHLSKETE